MTEKNKDKIREAIDLIGAENIEKLYSIFGNKRISFAEFHRELMKIKANLLSGKKSISKIAEELKTSRMTVYRYLFNRKKKSQ